VRCHGLRSRAGGGGDPHRLTRVRQLGSTADRGVDDGR
jgi:hypothetical protein